MAAQNEKKCDEKATARNVKLDARSAVRKIGGKKYPGGIFCMLTAVAASRTAESIFIHITLSKGYSDKFRCIFNLSFLYLDFHANV
jgi:hypothetical protein